MNERPLPGSGGWFVSVCLWVSADSRVLDAVVPEFAQRLVFQSQLQEP
jgi:hypothetical protein